MMDVQVVVNLSWMEMIKMNRDDEDDELNEILVLQTTGMIMAILEILFLIISFIKFYDEMDKAGIFLLWFFVNIFLACTLAIYKERIDDFKEEYDKKYKPLKMK